MLASASGLNRHGVSCRAVSSGVDALPAVRPPRNATSFHHGITYTSYEVNTFQLRFNTTGVKVLVDPWLVGDLTFLQQDWLYRGKKRAIGRTINVDVAAVAAETDVVVLTQGLDDHTHLPTLRCFPRDTFIVANPSAASKVRPLGFANVQVLDHGSSVDVAGGRLRITATQGALVGPPWSKRQNGLVFKELPQAASTAAAKAPAPGGSSSPGPSTPDWPGASVYFEPHADFVESSVAQAGPVDVVVSPVLTGLLGVGPVGYPLTMGDINLTKLLKILRPKVLVPLLNSEIDHTGPLGAFIQDRGSYDDLRAVLDRAALDDVRIEFPALPGEAMAIAL